MTRYTDKRLAKVFERYTDEMLDRIWHNIGKDPSHRVKSGRNKGHIKLKQIEFSDLIYKEQRRRRTGTATLHHDNT
jgi:hypothetical protein